jgi:serine/threonine protein kinase
MYVVTPLVRAPTLGDLLLVGPLGTSTCIHLLGQVGDALETAHEQGLVHQELEPRNILVDPRDGGHALLGDFGVVNEVGSARDAEVVQYHAPEEDGRRAAIPESNVYSLACIMLECLTGNPPWMQGSDGSEQLPDDLREVLAKAVASDPAERLASTRLFVASAARALGVEAPGPPTSRPDGWPWARPAARSEASGPREATPELRAPARAPAKPKRRAASSARSSVPVALVAVVALVGLAGFLAGRSGDDADTARRPSAAEAARLRAERDRAAMLRTADAALERLDDTRAAARRRMASARTRRGQTVEAARLGTAYRSTARALPERSSRIAPLAAALNRTAGAYRRLATAARRGDRRAYVRAQREVERDEGSLQRAIGIVGMTRP